MRLANKRNTLLTILLGVSMLIFSFFIPVYAQTKGGSSGIEENDKYKEVVKITSKLTKKIYCASLFSPEDNQKLIELKGLLYDLLSENSSEPKLAKSFYDAASIFYAREMPHESLELLSVVIENFPLNLEEEEESEEEKPVYRVDYSKKAQQFSAKIKNDLKK